MYSELMADEGFDEEVIWPESVQESITANYEDIDELFFRYANYDKNFEKFLNSYL